MAETTGLNRRSFLARVTGAGLGGAAFANAAQAQQASGVTDADPTDRAYQGGCSGATDRDSSDRAGCGHGFQPQTGSDRGLGIGLMVAGGAMIGAGFYLRREPPKPS